MFLPFVILALAPILSAFMYMAHFAIDIDPYVSYLNSQNQIDILRTDCMSGIQDVFIRQISLYQSYASDRYIPIEKYREMSDEIFMQNIVRTHDDNGDDVPLLWYSDDSAMVCHAKFAGEVRYAKSGIDGLLDMYMSQEEIQTTSYRIYAFAYGITDTGSAIDGGSDGIGDVHVNTLYTVQKKGIVYLCVDSVGSVRYFLSSI